MALAINSLPTDPALFALELENYRAAQGSISILEEIKSVTKDLNCFQGELSVEEFQEFLSYYWVLISVASIGKSRSLRVLHPREARGLKAAVVFIAGLEQGTFPRIYVNDWKLSPLARRELRTLGIDLETGEHYQT